MSDARKAVATWIRGPQLRERWGMSTAGFYRKLKSRLIPQPQYPFGPDTPYWAMADIEAFEQRVAETAPA